MKRGPDAASRQPAAGSADGRDRHGVRMTSFRTGRHVAPFKANVSINFTVHGKYKAVPSIPVTSIAMAVG